GINETGQSTTTCIGVNNVVAEWWRGILRDAGIAIEGGIAAVGFLPGGQVIETVYDIFSAASGYSFGGELTPTQRALVAGAIFVPGVSGVLVKNAGKVVEEALRIGGKHSGLLENYAKRTPEEIQKALKSYEKQVALHKEKIANPDKFAEDWNKMDTRAQEGLLRYWQKDLQRNQELAEIMRYLLQTKGVK
ncbi:MAG: hypothetical protein AB1414_20540, partial [bacterium]